MNLDWRCLSYNELKINELYDILHLRQAVFTVEQDCVYQDLDYKDQAAYHLIGRSGDIKAYARIFAPGEAYPEASIGRVITASSARGQGAGRELIAQALAFIEDTFNTQKARISAQQYLEKFYQSFGFKTVSEPYLEDKILHIEMHRGDNT